MKFQRNLKMIPIHEISQKEENQMSLDTQWSNQRLPTNTRLKNFTNSKNWVDSSTGIYKGVKINRKACRKAIACLRNARVVGRIIAIFLFLHYSGEVWKSTSLLHHHVLYDVNYWSLTSWCNHRWKFLLIRENTIKWLIRLRGYSCVCSNLNCLVGSRMRGQAI